MVYHCALSKVVLSCRFVQYAEQRQIATCIHLYLETDNAPASAVGTIALRVAAEVGACLLIVCRPPEPEKVWIDQPSNSSSVADGMLESKVYFHLEGSICTSDQVLLTLRTGCAQTVISGTECC